MLIQLLGNYPDKALRYKRNCNNLNVVLLQDGIYAAQQLMRDANASINCYAIENDWIASGIPDMKNVRLINYQEWVALCAEHQPVVTIQS